MIRYVDPQLSTIKEDIEGSLILACLADVQVYGSDVGLRTEVNTFVADSLVLYVEATLASTKERCFECLLKLKRKIEPIIHLTPKVSQDNFNFVYDACESIKGAVIEIITDYSGMPYDEYLDENGYAQYK